MKNKTILGLLLGVSMWGVTANAAQSAITCDRECLRGKVTQLLYAFLKHDVSNLPVADTLRVTEDAVEKPLAKVGLVRTVTRLRGFRQDIIDERAGVAGADVVVEESGAPVLLVVRLKVVADKLTEVELVATRSAAEGLIFNIDGLSAPSEVMNYAPRPEQLSTRDEAIKAALHYPAGLNAAKTFAEVDAPFAAGCLSLRKRPGDGRSRLQVLPPAARTSRHNRSRSSIASVACKRAPSPSMSAWASSGCAWLGACASAAVTSSRCGKRLRSTTAKSTLWRRS
jgi:hypothetical protein